MITKLVKIDESNQPGEIIHYDQFKLEYYNTTFPVNIENFDPRPYGYKKIFIYEELPIIDTKHIQSTLEYDDENDCYNLVYFYVDKSEEELVSVYEKKWQDVRGERNSKLLASDWTQLPDVDLSEDKLNMWKTYRQQLRDITNTSLSPYDITFPFEPQ